MDVVCLTLWLWFGVVIGPLSEAPIEVFNRSLSPDSLEWT